MKKNVQKITGGETAGTIKIHESVISSIVRNCVMKITGFSRFAGNSLVNNIAEIVGSKSIQGRAVTIEMNEDSVSVELRVVLEYGVYIPTVARDIQLSVAQAVSEQTGMTVAKVNVVIMDLEEKSTGSSLE